MIVTLWRHVRPILFGALGLACAYAFALGVEAIDDLLRGVR